MHQLRILLIALIFLLLHDQGSAVLVIWGSFLWLCILGILQLMYLEKLLLVAPWCQHGLSFNGKLFACGVFFLRQTPPLAGSLLVELGFFFFFAEFPLVGQLLVIFKY